MITYFKQFKKFYTKRFFSLKYASDLKMYWTLEIFMILLQNRRQELFRPSHRNVWNDCWLKSGRRECHIGQKAGRYTINLKWWIRELSKDLALWRFKMIDYSQMLPKVTLSFIISDNIQGSIPRCLKCISHN